MIVALVGAFATVAALVAAMVWLVSVARIDGAARAAALVRAADERAERMVAGERSALTIEALKAALARQTRRADALEEFARAQIIRAAGGIDDGVDLLLAELSIVAEGPSAEPWPGAAGGDRVNASVPDAEPTLGTAGGSGVDAPVDGAVSEGASS